MIDKMATTRMESTETPQMVNTTFSRKVSRMLWLELHTWEEVSLLALAGTAIAAIVLVMASYAVIRLQRAALRESAAQFEKYKVDADLKISEANERAALADLKTEQLREKLAPRSLNEAQKEAITLVVRAAKISKVTFVVQRDLEARSFALQLEIAFQAGGAKLSEVEMPPGEMMFIPNGVAMYRPGPRANSELDLQGSPLYMALKKANLFGGFVAGPFASPKHLGMGPLLDADQYIVYVGQKSPY
jgi:hypothetical protein